ncbi:hemin-degrading factor [Cytophaga aurantiaca]|uniref:hemin-degrading factor n=1 Tax=Cytophaga aurantiaca TaxID=29530 RepID=UPI000362289E|nr:hemin-degrading factor [Cytophaga aurantiaca]
MTTTTQLTLTERWNQFKIEFPKKRIREAAQALDVSEAELLATEVGAGTIKLEGDFSELYKQLPTLGRVMSLTRNDGCVLEHKGLFENINVQGEAHKVGTLIGSIEARAFFNFWKFAFASEVKTAHGSMKNIQFFDAAGVAVTKIYLLEEGGNSVAYQKIVDTYKAADQTTELEITPELAPTYVEHIDEAAFIADWTALKDTHDFFMMLRKYKVNRMRALEIAGNTFTRKSDKSKLTAMLEAAAKDTLPIMIFVGSKGNIQIHQDVIKTVRVMDNWLNILDPNFNMHLNLDEIADTWVVRKPTTDGEVTSIECFNKDRELVVQFFGLRKPGKPELTEWRELVNTI